MRFSTGLVGAILLGGLCAVQVRAINEPPTVQMTFHSATDKTMKVQFIGQGGVGYDIQNVAAGATGSYTFTANPHIVTVRVSGCLAQSQMW